RSVDRRSTRLSVPLILPGLPVGTQLDRILPTVTIAGVEQLGPSANTNTLFSTDVTQIVDTLSWQQGRHSVKVGIDGRLERLAILQPASPRGLFNFTAPFSGSRGTPNTLDGLPEGVTTGSLLAGASGLSVASFLLGQVGAFNIDLQPRQLRPRAKILELFAQDDLRVSSRLTINAGLRYTLNFPSTESDDQGAIFNLQTQELEYAGRNGAPRSARRLERLNFGPRIGLAWRLGERMVVRTGYGLVWQEQAGITTPFTLPQFPFIQTITQRSLDGVTPAFQLASGPTIRPLPLDARAGLGQGVFAVDRDLGSGYAQQWNLALQRELSRDLAIEIAYAGSKITRVGIPDSNI
ncbi:MAG: carboxypeptidase regulatory-like domain-containing protein, partial [Acidobacteria bacterium]|nr:carboxypeptidase regulatory-like domain-containing protein [Acidobacteriota bacterium]